MTNPQKHPKWYQKDYFTQHKTLRKRFWQARLSLQQAGKSTLEGMIDPLPENIETYLTTYYTRYFTWPWSWKARTERQRDRFKLINNLHAYEKEARYTLACSKNSDLSTLARTSQLQHHAPWGINALKGKPDGISDKPSKTQHILYRYGLPLWRFIAYSLLVLLLVTTAAALCFLAVTGGLGAPIAQLIAQTAQLFGLGSALNSFLGLAPVVWLTAHGGLTLAIATISTLFTALVHREIRNPGFYARALNQYGHVIGYNVADFPSVLASIPLLHSILTLAGTWGDQGLRAYRHGEVKGIEESRLTGTLHNIAQATPAPDNTGHLIKWLFNPVRWLQSALTFTFLVACFISEGRTEPDEKSHPFSGFLKWCAASIYFPVYLALEPLKALCDIPYHIMDICLVTPLENGIWQIKWRIENKRKEGTGDSQKDIKIRKNANKAYENRTPIVVENSYFSSPKSNGLNGSSNPVVTPRNNNPLTSGVGSPVPLGNVNSGGYGSIPNNSEPTSFTQAGGYKSSYFQNPVQGQLPTNNAQTYTCWTPGYANNRN